MNEHLAVKFRFHQQSRLLSLTFESFSLTAFSRASDACDVENLAEYSEIAKLIIEKKPKIVTITINQKQVERALSKVHL